MIGLFLSLLIGTTSSHAISADPNVAISAKDRAKYYDMALRSVVAVHSSTKSRCSGTLISPTQVLTSAHCFRSEKDGSPATFEILLLNGPQNVTQTIAVKNVTVNPLFPMGHRAIVEANAQLKSIDTEVMRIIMTSGDDCPLNKTQLSSKNLISTIATFPAVPKSHRACATAVAKIRLLASYYRNVLLDGERFDDEARIGDVAVAELAQPVADGYHRPMKIDFDFHSEKGDSRLALISGLGMVSDKKVFLQPVNPLIVGFTDFRGMVSDDLLKVAGSAVLCQGDSGGPTAYVQHDEMVLVAVNAGTTGCDFRGNHSEAIILRAHSGWLQSILHDSAQRPGTR